MLMYTEPEYGEFSVENLRRREKTPKSELSSFSVTPLTDERSEELQRGIHGDGSKKFYDFG